LIGPLAWTDEETLVSGPLTGAPPDPAANPMANPVARAVMPGFHAAVAGFARAGNRVIIDHVLLKPDWLADLRAQLADRPLVFVGVRCDLVHAHGPYDVDVDTSAGDLDAQVADILRGLSFGAGSGCAGP
jgi:chloramphenicol 3-O phosphotransferase